MGIEFTGFETNRFEFQYQTILDNVGLLNDEDLQEINSLNVSFGRGKFKKKESVFVLNTDSYVVKRRFDRK